MSHLVTTVAKDATCPRCQAAILTAHDRGLPAHIDPTPLPDRQAEIDALLAGKWTYEHTTYGSLIHRDPARIAAGQPRGTIHAQHKCNPTRNVQEGLF